MKPISELMMQEYIDNFFIELGTPCRDYLEGKIDFKMFQKLIETCYENWGSRTTLELNQEIADLIEDIETDYFEYDEPERSTRIKKKVKNFIDPIKDQLPIFARSDKRRVYWLINQYLSNRLNAYDFCDDYYMCFGRELNSDNLTSTEYKAFFDLSNITNYFSDDENDLKNYPGIYFSEDQLKRKVIETKELLYK